MAFNFLNKDGLTYFWNKIKARIGTATLTTTAQNLSGAVNELNSNLIKAKTLTASGTVSSAGGFSNVDFDSSELSGKTVVGKMISNVGATSSVNDVTTILFIDSYRVRVVSKSAQTITVQATYLYKG